MIRLSAPRWARRIRITATAACGVLAIAGCGDGTPAAPTYVEGAPDALQFSWIASETGGTSLELRGATVVVRHLRHGQNGGADSTTVVPTSRAWSRFLDAAAAAGVPAWRSDYLAEGIVDGSSWDLRMVVNGEVLEAHGTNAYPDGSGREHEMYPTDEFSAFIAALARLTGERIP